MLNIKARAGDLKAAIFSPKVDITNDYINEVERQIKAMGRPASVIKGFMKDECIWIYYGWAIVDAVTYIDKSIELSILVGQEKSLDEYMKVSLIDYAKGFGSNELYLGHAMAAAVNEYKLKQSELAKILKGHYKPSQIGHLISLTRLIDKARQAYLSKKIDYTTARKISYMSPQEQSVEIARLAEVGFSKKRARISGGSKKAAPSPGSASVIQLESKSNPRYRQYASWLTEQIGSEVVVCDYGSGLSLDFSFQTIGVLEGVLEKLQLSEGRKLESKIKIIFSGVDDIERALKHLSREDF